MSWLSRHRERVEKKLGRVFLDQPGPHFGYDLSRAAGVRSGAMYPALTRMLERQWLASGWEDERGDRPARRLYWLTPTGRAALEKLIG